MPNFQVFLLFYSVAVAVQLRMLSLKLKVLLVRMLFQFKKKL